jgi:hypothetical protein
MQPIPSTPIKTYPQRGPLQQFRFADSLAFNCFRCGQAKTSKLIAVYRGNWASRLCNACYGRLLSLYEIKAGTGADDERAEGLASALLGMVGEDEARQAERLFTASEDRAARLAPETLRFIATAEYVAGGLTPIRSLSGRPPLSAFARPSSPSSTTVFSSRLPPSRPAKT